MLNSSGIDSFLIEFHDRDKFMFMSSSPENAAFFSIAKGGKGLIFEENKKSLSYNCNNRNDYRSNECIRKYITQKLGCTLPWYKEEKSVRICKTSEDYDKFLQLRLDIYRGFGNLEEFGCLKFPDCKTKNWNRNVAFDLDEANIKAAAALLNHGNDTNFEELILLQLFAGSRDVRILHKTFKN